MVGRLVRRVFIVAAVLALAFSVISVQPIQSVAAGETEADLRKQLDELQAEQSELAAKKAESRQKLANTREQLGTTQEQIAAQREQMGDLEDQIAQIALQQYQDRGLNTPAVILASTSADDLLEYITMMQQVTDTANSLFMSLQLEQGTLADLVRSEQASLATIEAEQENLVKLDQEATEKIAKVSRLLNTMTSASAVVDSDKGRVGYNTVGVGVSNPDDLIPNPSSSLISPLSRYHPTDEFGMRVHPFTGRWSFHDGFDMAVGCGTSFVAPANGHVTEYYWAGGYGNRLVIDHGVVGGRHIVTSHNHLHSATVKRGASVIQGQVVGLVGSTGDSTGCHLHYMVWVNGDVQNPRDFM
jgi:murein DD-endopeptidase MepM/ murein hydrolase activator NlpD